MPEIAVLPAVIPCLLARTLDPEVAGGQSAVTLNLGGEATPATVVAVTLDEAVWVDAVVAEFASLQAFLKERV